MGYANFDDETLAGRNQLFSDAVKQLRQDYGFDFMSIGLASFLGAPLKWTYSAGSTSHRHERIVLAPGHGIGGIVLKAGKPMICADIEREMDPRAWSSYPIVFAEDLHGFFALPLASERHVVGVALCAYRQPKPDLLTIYESMLDQLDGQLCGLRILSDGFMDFEDLVRMDREAENDLFLGNSQISRAVSAQEEERRRIARELHDGVGQELLALSFHLAKIERAANLEEIRDVVDEARSVIEALNDQIHNIAVDLRPSTLDHFGLVPALRSTFTVYESRYGISISLNASNDPGRFSRAHETQLYRVLQEAVLNACKYSGSDEVLVTLEFTSGWMHATVRDNGHGFNVQQPTVRGSGCGLQNMRERALLAGGTLEVESDENGTSIRLVAPLVQEDSKSGDVK